MTRIKRLLIAAVFLASASSLGSGSAGPPTPTRITVGKCVVTVDSRNPATIIGFERKDQTKPATWAEHVTCPQELLNSPVAVLAGVLSTMISTLGDGHPTRFTFNGCRVTVNYRMTGTLEFDRMQEDQPGWQQMTCPEELF